MIPLLPLLLVGTWTYAGFMAQPAPSPPPAPAPPSPGRPAPPPRFPTYWEPAAGKWRGVARSGDTFEHADRATLEAFLPTH